MGDVRRWLYDQLWDNRVGTWFQPDLRVQRKSKKNDTSRGFLAVASEETVIERGDVVHLDFGITYMGLNTDWQKMAYVLQPGEKDAPAGLKNAMKNTNDAAGRAHARAPGPVAARRRGLQPDHGRNEAEGHRGADLQPPHRQPGARPRPEH